MNDPEARKMFRRVWLTVKLKNVGTLVLLKNGVAPIHLPEETAQCRYGILLIFDQAVAEMRQALEGEVVDPKLRVYEQYSGLFERVGAGDRKDQILHQHRLTATGHSCNQGMRRIFGRRHD